MLKPIFPLNLNLSNSVLEMIGMEYLTYIPGDLGLHRLPFCYYFLTKTLFATMNVSKFREGRVHIRSAAVKRPKRTLFTVFKRFHLYITHQPQRRLRLKYSDHTYSLAEI